jgi:hypothetical protein
VDEEALDARVAPLLERLPPAVERHLHVGAAEALDGRELRLGRMIGDDHGEGDAQLARRPADALRHVAGARRQDAGGEAVARRLRHRVVGAPDLEGADRLEVLELEVDLGRRVVHREADERRAHGGAGDCLARAADVRERDQSSTSVPAPLSRARS